jgi:hypothetical protein
MTVALDHLFICTSSGAPEAERLAEFGLIEGTPNCHPGQGTANRRFFFHNAMLVTTGRGAVPISDRTYRLFSDGD